jgi:hypothetical protein
MVACSKAWASQLHSCTGMTAALRHECVAHLPHGRRAFQSPKASKCVGFTQAVASCSSSTVMTVITGLDVAAEHCSVASGDCLSLDRITLSRYWVWVAKAHKSTARLGLLRCLPVQLQESRQVRTRSAVQPRFAGRRHHLPYGPSYG